MTTQFATRLHWGFFATLGWTLLAAGAALLTAVIIGKALGVDWLGVQGSPSVTIGTMLAYSVLMSVLVLAARLSGLHPAEYFGLARPRGRYVLGGVFCFSVGAMAMFGYVAHFDTNQLLMAHNDFHPNATLSVIALHFLAVVIPGPVFEELLVRGFLYRGLSTSRIGVVGAILVTSVLWMFMHGGRGFAGNIDLVVAGAALGWLRWYSGSTYTTIVAHVAHNVLFTALSIYGLYFL